jgi:glycosyltransferase involved in cell wall biosynthesis
MGLTVLSVAYPFAPVGPDTAGGAEHVVHQLDQALVRAGHRSIVVAREDSRVDGTLVPVPQPAGAFDDGALRATREQTRRAIEHALASLPIDLVHMHGSDFHYYLPAAGIPLLATLHLPVSWYPREALPPARAESWINCVSQAQHATCPPHPRLLPPIENGVPIEDATVPHAKRAFALMLCRICPEKGVHLAIEAAKEADVTLLIAGEIYPYDEHRRYFAEQVRPRLDRRRRFIGIVAGARKRRLLAAARCLLVPSLVAETSSLAAREALAVGTPVVAFPAGALVDIVEHGRTGFLVEDVPQMVQAIRDATAIDPDLCRATARARFSVNRMIERYFGVYAMLARRPGRAGHAGAAA